MPKEDKDRVVHRYGLMLSHLGLTEKELKDTTPGEAREIIKKAISNIKNKREEHDIIDQSCTITLAGKEVVVDLLPMSAEKKWRTELATFVSEAGKSFSGINFQSGEVGLSEIMGTLVPYLINEGEDKILDLFFLYAKNLNKEEMYELAENDYNYREDLLDAAIKVFKVFAVPFLVRRIKRLMSLQEVMN